MHRTLTIAALALSIVPATAQAIPNTDPNDPTNPGPGPGPGDEIYNNPVAKVTPDHYAALEGGQVTLRATGSRGNSGGALKKWEWDLDGNGTYEVSNTTNAEQVVTLTGRGATAFGLRVTANDGNVATDTATVTSHLKPTALFDYVAPVYAGESVELDATESYDDSGIQTYSWYLDADLQADASGVKTTTTFATPGTYSVTLQVIDVYGEQQQITRNLEVTEKPAPTPTPTATPETPKDTAAPVVTIAGSPAKLSKKGKVALSIACPATEQTCQGSVAMRKFGSAPFALIGGQSATVRLKASKSARRALKRKRSVTATATATATDAAGNSGTVTARIKVKR